MAELITRDTTYICSVVLAEPSGRETVLVLGDTINVSDNVVYTFGAAGGYYTIYDSAGAVLDQRVAPPITSTCYRGGSIPVISAYASIILGPTVRAKKSISVTVGEIVDSAESLEDLYSTLALYCVSDEDVQQIVNIYLASNGGSGGTGKPGKDGKDGVTYAPHMSDTGVLSWTNDGGLDNPPPTNLVGPPGKDGGPGTDGVNGATYTPHMSSTGDLSWTNDGGLPNPDTVNLMGPPGSSSAVDLSSVYPVGAIYMSTLATAPDELFGFGTWERIKDKFLLSAGDAYTAGSVGGEATHTLTVDELPPHAHKAANYAGITGWSGNSPHNFLSNDATSYINATNIMSSEVGGGAAHNNMPPYLVVYAWQRTA